MSDALLLGLVFAVRDQSLVLLPLVRVAALRGRRCANEGPNAAHDCLEAGCHQAVTSQEEAGH